MHTTEKEDCGIPSEVNGEEGENKWFEEEDDFEGARVGPILEEIICHIDDPHSPGNQYTETTRLWTFELLRTCGSKVLDMVRGQFSVSSRHAFLKGLLPITLGQTWPIFRW
jgi:hypothetical protein